MVLSECRMVQDIKEGSCVKLHFHRSTPEPRIWVKVMDEEKTPGGPSKRVEKLSRGDGR